MTWVRIDDGAPLHPKLLDAGPEAAWLWTCGLAYCNRNHTDGLIAARHLAALYPGAWPAPRLEELAARLVTVRLWDADGPDYRVHDYAHYQEEATREVVDARRVYERERKRAQRLKGRPGHVPDNVPGTIAGHVPGTTTGTPPGTEGGTAPAPADMPPAAPPTPTHAPVVPAPRPVPSRPDPGSEIQNPEIAEVGAAPLRLQPQGVGPAAPAALAKPKRAPKAPPPAELPPADPKALAVYLAIVNDRVLQPITARPADLAERMTAAGAFPGVNVLSQVHRAAAHAAGARRPYRDGRAFLLGWLGRADKEAPEPSPLASGVYSVPMPSRYSREAPPAAIPPPPVVRKGDLAVDAPVMPAAQARPYVANLMAQFRAGVPITPDGATGNG